VGFFDPLEWRTAGIVLCLLCLFTCHVSKPAGTELGVTMQDQKAVFFEKIYVDEISDNFDWIEHAYIDEHVNKILYLDMATLWHYLKSYVQTGEASYLTDYRRRLTVMMMMSDLDESNPLGYIEKKRNAYQNEKDANREVYDV
jgi:hypothetical protein